MGILDQVLGSVGAGPGGRKPTLGGTVAAGVVLALLVKGVRSYQAHQATAAGPSTGATPAQSQRGSGGLLGGLSGMLSGAGGLGGVLGGLGGAGALAALVRQLQQGGYARQVNSWVGPGENIPLAPHELEAALGHDTLQSLQEHTGMPKEALLSDLSRTLPDAVHELTPEGREPNDSELERIAAIGS
jgi:uncharacterized protein YidB (DUF937 family)